MQWGEKMNTTAKKAACFLPGFGTPISLYYTITSRELRGTALKGLAILPAAVVLLAMNTIVPSQITLIAGAYLYWGMIALAGGWGFVTLLVAWKAIENNILPVSLAVPLQTAEPAAEELIPSVSVSEILPDMDASSILSGIERLPREEKRELVAEIVKRVK
ncbi:hypothetical protein BMS3Abin16_01634 [archaeon BMS3Abin16]|nr:hypothetical protein BMS3Abin16_01634 [archaeon BMS3Abin16]